MVNGASPAAAAFREQGLTPTLVEIQVARLAGPPVDRPHPGRLDREALAAIGIDLDTVSARIEATFGKDALSTAAALSGRRRSSLRRAVPPRLTRAWRRRHTGRAVACGRAKRAVDQPGAMPTARADRRSPRQPTGHLPVTGRAKKVLQETLMEARARHDPYIGVQHLAVALAGTREGMIPRIFGALNASPDAVIQAVNDRYRRAS
jgi:hypothetical protein